jgi:hypothetical protein
MLSLNTRLIDLSTKYQALHELREELDKELEPVRSHWVNFMLSFRAAHQKKHGHYTHPPTAVIPEEYFPPYGGYGYELSQEQTPGFVTYEGEDNDNQPFCMKIPMAFVDDPESFKVTATSEWNSAIETYLVEQKRRSQQSETDRQRAEYLKLKAKFEPES